MATDNILTNSAYYQASLLFICALMLAIPNTLIQQPRDVKQATKSRIKYSVKGFAYGFADSIWLLLDKIDNMGRDKPLVVDSVVIVNEKLALFHTTNLSKKYRRYMLRTKSYSGYKYFWIDKTGLVISGIKDQFNHALVDGSSSQKLSEDFKKIAQPFELEIHSLRRNYGATDSAIWNRILTLEEDLKEATARFIRQNNSSIVSAYLLSLYCKKWGAELSKELYNTLTQGAKNNELGLSINNFIKYSKDIDIAKN